MTRVLAVSVNVAGVGFVLACLVDVCANILGLLIRIV